MNTSTTVLMSFPPELGGGDPVRLLHNMGLRATSGASTNTWEVGLDAASDLVTHLTLATPWNNDRKFDRLKMYPAGLPPELSALYEKTQRRLTERADKGDIAALLNRIQLETTSVENSQIAALADYYDKFLGKLHADIEDEPHFPNHTTHVVNFDELLYKRSKLIQILIRIDQDPEFTSDLASAKYGQLPLGEIFNSNDSLLYSLRVGDMYLAPLLGCRSPGLWAVNGQRLFGSIIFNLGSVVAGLGPTPPELLQLLPRTLDEEPPLASAPQPPTRRSYGQAIDWWAHRLNQMFKYSTNPTLFADYNRCYLPYVHQNWLMTIDQLFRRIASINLGQRDLNAQLVLMFGAMDVIGDRITEDGKKLYRPRRADEALQLVRSRMPLQVAEMLVPKAERAVKALRAVQDGFFIKAQRATPNVRLVNENGAVEQWDMETATCNLLRARRNAVHGFGGLGKVIGDPVRILAQHDGKIPRELVDLPYLYLLEFLCSPDETAKRIRDSAAEWNKATGPR